MTMMKKPMAFPVHAHGARAFTKPTELHYPQIEHIPDLGIQAVVFLVAKLLQGDLIARLEEL